MKTHTICQTHNTTILVGPGTLMGELECPTCLALDDGIIPTPTPTDPEAAFVARITQHHNGNCCCPTCDPHYCYNCGHYEGFCECPVEPVVGCALPPDPEGTPF